MKKIKRTELITIAIIMIYTIIVEAYLLKGMALFIYEKQALVATTAFLSLVFCVSILKFFPNKAETFTLLILYCVLFASQLIFPFMSQNFVPICMPAMIISIIYRPYCGISFHMLYCVSYYITGGKWTPILLILNLILGIIGCLVTDFMDTMTNIVKSFGIIYVTAAILNVMKMQYLHGKVDYFKLITLSIPIAITILACFLCIIFKKILTIRNNPKKKDIYTQYIHEDFQPIKELRENHIRVYYHCVEVADIAAAAASGIGADAMLTRTGAMYHDIGKMLSNSYVKASLLIANENKLPKEVIALIEEHNGKIRLPQSKEAGILLLADTLVSTKDYMTKAGKKIDDKKIIDSVMSLRLENGFLDESGLSLSEFKEIKKTFIQILCGNNER